MLSAGFQRDKPKTNFTELRTPAVVHRQRSRLRVPRKCDHAHHHCTSVIWVASPGCHRQTIAAETADIAATELAARLCPGCWTTLVGIEYSEFVRLTRAIASAGFERWVADPT